MLVLAAILRSSCFVTAGVAHGLVPAFGDLLGRSFGYLLCLLRQRCRAFPI